MSFSSGGAAGVASGPGQYPALGGVGRVRAVGPSELVTAANYLNQHFAGFAFHEIRHRIQDELKQLRSDMTELMSAAVEAGSEVLEETQSTYVISGPKAWWCPAAADAGTGHSRSSVARP